MPVELTSDRLERIEYEKVAGPEGLAIRVVPNDEHRTCSECEWDCEPDVAVGIDGLCSRIAFICPEYGVHSMIDPFEHLR